MEATHGGTAPGEAVGSRPRRIRLKQCSICTEQAGVGWIICCQRKGALRRLRLETRPAEVLDCPLTLVQAGTGYGKSTTRGTGGDLTYVLGRDGGSLQFLPDYGGLELGQLSYSPASCGRSGGRCPRGVPLNPAFPRWSATTVRGSHTSRSGAIAPPGALPPGA